MLTVKEVADRWSVSMSTVYSLFNSGVLPGLRLSPKNIRFREEDILHYETSSWNKEETLDKQSVSLQKTSNTSFLETQENLEEPKLFGSVPIIKFNPEKN